MRVVIAPDSFGGHLRAGEVAAAIADGWRTGRPEDDLVLLPLSDGGEGLLDVLARDGDRFQTVEVAGPLATPVEARFLVRADGSAVIEAAEACGLHLLGPELRDPVRTTTYGVGQLLEAARHTGARRLVVGVGGSSTVDGGAGALLALGFRLRRANGHGLKVGGGELIEVSSAEPTWVDPAWRSIEVEVWADVRTPLLDAAAVYAPQKGADADAVGLLERALERWVGVVTRDLGQDAVPDAGDRYTGAAGGLAYGLAAGLGARLVAGAAAIGDDLGFEAALAGASLVVTGEGRLDATSREGKVVGYVAEVAAGAGIPAVAVAGVHDGDAGLADVEEASPGGPGEDPAADVAAAARRLAGRVGA